MVKLSQHVYDALPAEYRKIAEQLFPPEGFTGANIPPLRIVFTFADALGIGADFSRVLNSPEADKTIKTLLGHFQNNLDLLIQKTWVEKADELRKEKLQNNVPRLIAKIESGEYKKALVDFGIILEELAYLFFGAQSNKEDFTEYVFRIDAQMGLFWWYGGRLHLLANAENKELLRAVLLIGICFLTDF